MQNDFKQMVTALALAAVLFAAAVIVASAAGQTCGPNGCPPQGQGWQPQQITPQTPRYDSEWIGSPNATAYPFVCRIECGDGSAGSGVLIAYQTGGAQIVLTAAHVVKSGRTYRCFFGRNSYGATLRAIDTVNDVALLTIPVVPPGVTGAKIAEADPAPGENMTLAGHGGRPRRGFSARGARLIGRGQTTLRLSAASSHGDSGGAVLDSRGRLCGLISATSQDNGSAGYTVAVSFEPLRTILGIQHRRHGQQRQQYQIPQQYTQPPQQPTPADPRQQYVAPVLPDLDGKYVTSEQYEADKAYLIAKLQEGGVDLQFKADVEQAKTDAVAARTDAGLALEAVAHSEKTWGTRLESIAQKYDKLKSIVDLVPQSLKDKARDAVAERLPAGKLEAIEGYASTALDVAGKLREARKGDAATIKAAVGEEVDKRITWTDLLVKVGAGVALGSSPWAIAAGAGWGAFRKWRQRDDDPVEGRVEE